MEELGLLKERMRVLSILTCPDGYKDAGLLDGGELAARLGQRPVANGGRSFGLRTAFCVARVCMRWQASSVHDARATSGLRQSTPCPSAGRGSRRSR